MDIDEARRIIKETDEKIARLFERRMEAVKEVSEYKKSHSLPVYDPEREAMLLENNLSKIESDEFRPYYTDVFKSLTGVSKEYQNKVVSDAVRVSSPEGGYELFFDASIDRAGEYFDLDRKCLIVTDENVLPYAKRVAARCTFARVVTFPAGERTKCEESLHRLWSECCSFGMTDSIAASELKKAGLEPLIDENGDIYLKDVKIDNANFSLACLIMSPASGTFYKLVGSSSFTKKAEAENAYNSLLSQLRETYPNLQVVRNPQGGEKMCTYSDDENGMYLLLRKSKNKEGDTVFYLNINYWNKFLDQQIKDAITD